MRLFGLTKSNLPLSFCEEDQKWKFHVLSPLRLTHKFNFVNEWFMDKIEIWARGESNQNSQSITTWFFFPSGFLFQYLEKLSVYLENICLMRSPFKYFDWLRTIPLPTFHRLWIFSGLTRKWRIFWSKFNI